jgi:hypothetical protein
MSTMAAPAAADALILRLRTIGPDAPRRWGRMTDSQMVCHLSDSFRAVMGEREVGSAETFFRRTVLRWIALNAPMRWPTGFPTRPEMDQTKGGTPPAEFAADVADLETLIRRFCADPRDFAFARHPLFGAMSDRDWARWAWLHTDHHLRQFGA